MNGEGAGVAWPRQPGPQSTWSSRGFLTSGRRTRRDSPPYAPCGQKEGRGADLRTSAPERPCVFHRKGFNTHSEWDCID